MRYLSLKNIYRRLKSETPTFFKKIRRIMLALGALGPLLKLAKFEYPEELSFLPKEIAGYLILTGILGTAFSSLPVKHTHESEVK